MANESVVLQEVLSQPEVWAATWSRLQASRDRLGQLAFSQCWDMVLFAGCGSTHYLALAAANLYQQLVGQRARGVPSSELALFPGGVYADILGQQVLLVAVSRSGETTETLWAVQKHRERQWPVLAVTCRGQSPLAGQSNVVLAVEDADERSVPQTRSFTSMYLATQYLAGLMANDEGLLGALQSLPAAGRAVLERYTGLVARIGAQAWERIVVLGSGPYYGLACEAMLKLKEMAISWSEAYHFYEFRHGPISLVDERTLVVGLLSDTALGGELAVLADVRGLGGHTLAISEGATPAGADAQSITLGSGLPEGSRGALYLLPLQLLAYHRARARGLDPDQPRHLQQAVVLDHGLEVQSG